MKHNTITISLIFLTLIIFGNCASQSEFPILKGSYLGQKPPGMTPKTFASNIISTKENQEGCSGFMKGGTLFIFSPTIPGTDWKYKPTYFMELQGDKWTKPVPVPFNDLSPYNFTVAPDGKTLYFTTLRSAKNSTLYTKQPRLNRKNQ